MAKWNPKVSITRRNILSFVRYISGDNVSMQDIRYLNHKIDEFEKEVIQGEKHEG
jgi:hypothetical protein